MQPRVLEQIPRFGWTQKVIFDNITLGDGGGANPVVTDVVPRPPGMFRASVVGTVAAFSTSGEGRFGLVLEGSNYGDGNNPWEWYPIAASAIDDQFVSPSAFAFPQVRLLGGSASSLGFIFLFGTAGDVNIGRFGYLRVRAEVSLGTLQVLTNPTSAGATVTIRGGGNVSNMLTPAGGPRTPGQDDYDNTLGSPAAIAADIAAAINDAANSFLADVVAEVNGDKVTIRPQIANGFSGFNMTSALPAEIAMGPTFDDLSVRVTGTAGDGEKFLKTRTIISNSGESNTQNSTFIKRTAGAKYLTATAKLIKAIWDPANSLGLDVSLQGALDEESAKAGEWFSIDRAELRSPIGVPPPPDGIADLFNTTGGIVLDMGPFNYFRALVEPAGPVFPTDISSYEIEFIAAFDDNDWLNGEAALSELSSTLQSQFFQVRWGTPEEQVGDTIQITGQLVDMNGVPITGVTGDRELFLILSADPYDKDNNLDGTMTMTSGNLIGTINNSNKIAVQAEDGQFEVTIDDGGAPGVTYLSSVIYTNSGGLSPFSSGSGLSWILISSEVVELTFV